MVEYVPAAHALHDAASRPDQDPAAQAWHVFEPVAEEKYPARQTVQVMVEAPASVEYWPALQPVQASDDVAATLTEYVPATQSRQDDELCAAARDE